MINTFYPQKEIYITQEKLYEFFDERKSQKYIYSLRNNKHFSNMAKKDSGKNYLYNPYYFIEYKDKYDSIIEEAEELYNDVVTDNCKISLAKRLSIKSDKIKSVSTWKNFLTTTSWMKLKSDYISFKEVPKTVEEFLKYGKHIVV